MLKIKITQTRVAVIEVQESWYPNGATPEQICQTEKANMESGDLDLDSFDCDEVVTVTYEEG